MQQQKTFLESNGWTCNKCGCTGAKGWDCINNNFKGYMIQLKNNMAKIHLKGRLIASGLAYQLETKMHEQNIL